jgi:hypothetical protein
MKKKGKNKHQFPILLMILLLLVLSVCKNKRKLDLSGHWKMTGGSYSEANPPFHIIGISPIDPISGILPTGTLVFTPNSYEISYDMIVAYDSVELRLSREESGDYSIHYDYEAPHVLAASYWHGDIHFEPYYGAEWKANFRHYREGALIISSIPEEGGTLELVFRKK